jgi:hypothetical protein
MFEAGLFRVLNPVKKFERTYELFVQTQSGSTITFTLPFTIEFDITRTTLGSTNVCQVRIYNLNEKTRKSIAFNAFNQGGVPRRILLKGGYGIQRSTIFSGNIHAAWSVREGTNFITQIECFDGGFGFVNGDVNLSFTAGTPLKTVIEELIANVPDVTVGAIGNFNTVLTRGNTYSGNPAQLLYEITGGAFYVDAGKAYALKSDEYLTDDLLDSSNSTFEINDSTGLLNTPVLEQNTARFEMLFEPGLNLGRRANVNSLTNPFLNGSYKITSVKHRGMISPAVAGKVTTIAEFYFSKSNVPVALDAPGLGLALNTAIA